MSKYAIKFDEKENRTKSEFAPDSDINNIMRKYHKTGMLPNAKTNPLYGDFASVPTYREACDIVLRAQQQFYGLPSEIRARCHNEPSEFLAFCADPVNSKMLEEYGLKKPSSQNKNPQTPDVVTMQPSGTEAAKKPMEVNKSEPKN